MARIYEYQAKQLLKMVGIPVPKGSVASTAEEASQIALDIGRPVAIKAQIWVTGRFKVGGIKFASGAEETKKIAEKLLGNAIKGLPIKKVLVEEKLDIDKEFYCGVIVNDSYKIKGPVSVFSSEGGVDVEEVAARNPERVATMAVNYLEGVRPSVVHQLISRVSFNGALSPELSDELA